MMILLATIVAAPCPAAAQTAALAPALSGIAFLVGTWSNGIGTVAETGGTSRGSSTITAEVNGSVLLRRDRTELFGADGKATGNFAQIMMIYPQDGELHADYSDGEHIIHYTSAAVDPGRSVVFTSPLGPTTPAYRLTYVKADATTLTVRFEVEPPGQNAFRPIATGTLHQVK